MFFFKIYLCFISITNLSVLCKKLGDYTYVHVHTCSYCQVWLLRIAKKLHVTRVNSLPVLTDGRRSIMPKTMVPPPAKACLTSSDSEHSAFDRPKRRIYRETTVYDAVAGRACYRGLIRKPPLIASTRDTASSSTVRIPPEEVLFRSRGAPQRYEETDFYWANEKLPLQGAELPDSDLLKAVHAYASNFYGRKGGKADFRSLDETALMAVGVLLEEWADDLLGNGGEGVFVEGEAVKGAEAVKEGESIHRGEGLKEGEAANDEEAVKAEEEMVGEWYASEILGHDETENEEGGQRRKRRKV